MEEENYYILVTLLINVCPIPMRELFLRCAKSDSTGNIYTTLDAYLSYRKADVMKLKRKKQLRQDQLDQIFPLNAQADVETWDITLLSLLLQHLFANDVNGVLKNIDAIRRIRNGLQHIPGTANVTDADFQSMWQQLESATCAIANFTNGPVYEKKIEQEILKTKTIHIRNIGAILRQWFSAQTTELKCGIASLEEKIENLQQELAEIKSSASLTKETVVRVTGKRKRKDIIRHKWFNTMPPVEKMRDEFAKTSKRLLQNFYHEPLKEISRITEELDENHFALICGPGRSGYLQTTLSAIDTKYEKDECIEMSSTADWNHVEKEDASLVLFVDPFKTCKDEASAIQFKSMLNSMQETLKEDDSVDIVIVTDQSALSTFKAHYTHDLLENPIKLYQETSENFPAVIESEPAVQWKRDNDPNYKSLVAKSVSYVDENSRVNIKETYLESAREKFRAKKSVVLSGPRGCGKTALALSLLRSYQDGHYVIVTDPDELTYVRFGFTCVILIEDLGGKYIYDRNIAQKWLQKFEFLNAAVQQGKMNVIITCETDRLNTIRADIFRHCLLENEVSIGTDGVVEIKQEDGTLSKTKVSSGISSLRGLRFTQALEGRVYEVHAIYEIKAISQCPDGSYITLCYVPGIKVLVRLDSSLQETHRYTSLPDDENNDSYRFINQAEDICCTQTGDLVVLFGDNISIYKVGDNVSLLNTVRVDNYDGRILVRGNRICYINNLSITFYDLNLKQKGQATKFPLIVDEDDYHTGYVFFQNQLFFMNFVFLYRVNTQEQQMKYIQFDELFHPLSICCIDEESILVLGYQHEVPGRRVWRILQFNGSLDVHADFTFASDNFLHFYYFDEFHARMVYDRVNKRLIVANKSAILELHLQY